MSAWGLGLLRCLTLGSAACEEGDVLVGLAAVGPGCEGMLALRCGACALTAVRYLAAFACFGSISARTHVCQSRHLLRLTT